MLHAGVVNIQHDVVQTRIHFLRFPAHTRRVLRHFQTGRRDATGVSRFTRSKQHASVEEQVGRFDGGGHVGAFRHGFHAVGNQHARRINVELVLGGTRQRDIHRYTPQLLAFEVDQTKFTRIVGNATVAAGFNFAQTGQLLFGETGLIDDGTAGVGGGDNACTEFHRFFDGVLCDVTGAGNGHTGAFKAKAMTLEHRFRKVHQAITGGFRTNQTAAERKTFAGKYAGGVVGEFFHHPGHKADFTPTDANVTGWDIGVRAQMTIQFGHQ